MCGLVGWVSRDVAARREAAAQARDCMLHRGLDDTGFWIGFKDFVLAGRI